MAKQQKKAPQRTDYDSPWKEIIEQFFSAFIEFFFPAIYADIDWAQPYEFLDKELQKTIRRATTGRNTVDKLVKVWRRDGVETWVLVHIEIQSQVDPEFERRMYVINCLLFDRYARQVVSLAIVGDEDPLWRPKQYGYNLWGCEVGIKFPSIKLLDYAGDWTALEASNNPFAVVVMAHLKAKETRRRVQDRLRWKIELIRGLYKKGYTRKQVLELFRFIDWVLDLPDHYELRFEHAVKELEEADRMRYVTTIERRAMQKGQEQGIEQGIEQGVLNATRDNIGELITLRFGPISQDLIAQLMVIDDLAQLKGLLREVALAGSLEEIERLFGQR